MKTVEISRAICVIIEKLPYWDKLPDIDKVLLIQDLTGIVLDYHNQKMEEIMPELFDWIIIFVQKARVVDDPRLDRLFELDDLYQKVYSDNRIRHDFFIAAQMAYMAVFNEIFKSFLKQEEK